MIKSESIQGVADLGLNQEGSVRLEVEGTFRDDTLCTRMVLLRFHGRVTWDGAMGTWLEYMPEQRGQRGIKVDSCV